MLGQNPVQKFTTTVYEDSPFLSLLDVRFLQLIHTHTSFYRLFSVTTLSLVTVITDNIIQA